MPFPVLVNSARDCASFAAVLEALLADPAVLSEMGVLGREYVVSRYTSERVREALMQK